MHLSSVDHGLDEELVAGAPLQYFLTEVQVKHMLASILLYIRGMITVGIPWLRLERRIINY